MKKIAVLFGMLFCTVSIPSFADSYIYFGGHYSNTIVNSKFAHGIGANFSSIGYYGGAKKLYSALGFTADVSNKRDINSKDLKKLGVKDIKTRFYSLPMRIGYPFTFKIINENTNFLLIPALAFNFHFFRADFTQKITIYKLDYEMSGWGFSMGPSLNLGIDHKLNKVYLRYGLDFDMRLLALLLVDIKYTGDIKGSVSSSSTDTIADSFMLTTSPYICLGFKL